MNGSEPDKAVQASGGTQTETGTARDKTAMDRRSPSRRGVLGAIGATLTVGIAGCTGGGEPTYERRAVEPPADAEPRTPTELTAAAQLATTETNEGVIETDTIDLTGHEFVFEPGYLGSTVQGTVVNRDSDRIELVEIRVRVYDTNGRLLGRYVDSAADLDAGETWSFTAIILESPGDISAYDIAALGTPP
jgi:hypothetical protein